MEKQYTLREELIGSVPYLIILVLNIATVGHISNLLISVPQVLFVLYKIISAKYDEALFYNLIFTILCIGEVTAGGVEDINTDVMYSYARLKVVGPVGVSYLISLIILAFTYKRKIDASLFLYFHKLKKTFSFLWISAVSIGVIGFLISDYQIKEVVNRSVYLFIIIINMICLMKCDSKFLRESLNRDLYRLLWSGSVASVFSYIYLGAATSYGGVAGIILQPDICYFSAMLLFALFDRNKIWVMIGLLCFAACTLSSSGGKHYFIIGSAVPLIFFMAVRHALFKKHNHIKLASTLLILIFIGSEYTRNVEMSQMAANKQHSVISVFGGMDEMTGSPYIRTASIINIVNNGLSNPFFLIWGHGYGGYFTDDLGLFNGFDLTKGCWKEEVVKTGKFTSAHDTFASVPLYNGFWGLYILLLIGLKYYKRTIDSPYAFAAVPFIIFTFYFNTQFAFTGLLFLYASEYYKLPQ